MMYFSADERLKTEFRFAEADDAKRQPTCCHDNDITDACMTGGLEVSVLSISLLISLLGTNIEH